MKKIMKCHILHIFLGAFILAINVNLSSSILKSVILPRFVARVAFRYALDVVNQYPIRIVVNFINGICKVLTNSGILGKSEVEEKELSLSLQTKKGSVDIALKECEKFVESEYYHKDRNLTIFIPGWMNKADEFQVLKDAYIDRDEDNFAIYDMGTYLNNLYSFAAYNIKDTGEYLGLCLSKIADSVKSIHLIGTNLGAQIAARAAEIFEANTKRKINRITALDPSKPCSNNFLSKNSAEFVDAIHSTKCFGTEDPVGHADFYVNRIYMLSPGCSNFLCSHLKPVLYFARTVHCDEVYRATRCESQLRFFLGKCNKNAKVDMGLNAPRYARGTYYVKIDKNALLRVCKPLKPETTTKTVELTSTTLKDEKYNGTEIEKKTTPADGITSVDDKVTTAVPGDSTTTTAGGKDDKTRSTDLDYKTTSTVPDEKGTSQSSSDATTITKAPGDEVITSQKTTKPVSEATTKNSVYETTSIAPTESSEEKTASHDLTTKASTDEATTLTNPTDTQQVQTNADTISNEATSISPTDETKLAPSEATTIKEPTDKVTSESPEDKTNLASSSDEITTVGPEQAKTESTEQKVDETSLGLGPSVDETQAGIGQESTTSPVEEIIQEPNMSTTLVSSDENPL